MPLRILAFLVAFLVLQAYGVFGWQQRRFSVRQIAIVASVTGLVVGILMGFAVDAQLPVIIIITSFWIVTFPVAAVLVTRWSRKRMRAREERSSK